MATDNTTQVILNGTDNVFVAANQAGQATSTALSTTQTGFTLYNPLGSGKNLVVMQTTVACTTAPAGAATLVYAANVNPNAASPATNTALSVRNAVLGKPNVGVGVAYSATTLPAAPVVVRSLGGPVGASSISPPFIKDDVNGALVLVPGTCLSINSLTTAISAVFSMTWKEVDAF